MKISDGSWSARIRTIGDIERADHHHLRREDAVGYFGEYTARAGFGHSDTNNLILNLKKKPGSPGAWYKQDAIATAARSIREAMNPHQLPLTCFVPAPSSKAIGSQGYDDRVLRMCRAIGPSVDVRPILLTTADRQPLHEQSDTRDPNAIRGSLAIDGTLLRPIPSQIVLLDDMLTTGCTFRACSDLLNEVWPEIPVYGLFIARRAPSDNTMLFGEV